ncbi:large ribosomal subunit protein P2-like [Panulirus ornatus]|uniref:large ribosomal subunit protein P2-like n=1 Tax=Panulirus ornatus TaxID=150431 RepID=UPI003A8BCFC7
MRHIAAYLLASMGNMQPTASNIKSILASVGVEADEKQLAVLIDKLSGKDVNQLIASGSTYISAMPACGGGGGGGAVVADAPAAGAATATVEKKEEKKEEPEEESDDDMGFGLFD